MEELKGLSSQEASQRLSKFGPNALPETPPPSSFQTVLAQLKSPLVYILIAAGLVTFFLSDYSDTLIILLAITINTILGYFQESKASKALHALKQLIHPQAQVVRDGQIQKLDSEKIVPGDIVILHQGDKIPADGFLLEANRLYVSEAILTGESVPVHKSVKDKAFMGTIITAGQAKMLVETTAHNTEMGKIALEVQKPEEDTPLRRQLKGFSSQLTYLVIGLTIFVFLLGFLRGQELFEIFKTAVALAVSSIPEGLLVGLSVVLALGMQRLVAKKGLVRKLVSAETLGGVTTICVDKTGTLTKGEMHVIDALGDEEHLANQMILANDLDDPLVIAGYQWASQKLQTDHFNLSKFKSSYKRLDSIPFSSQDRFFACLVDSGDKDNTLYVNGAPEFIADWSTLSGLQKKEIKSKVESLTKEGKRVIGLAKKSFKGSSINKTDAQSGLEWVGILSFSDPVREGVKEALQNTQIAGIKLIVITGDYPQTAVSVLKQLNLPIKEENIILGETLKKMVSSELSKILKSNQTLLFARTTPNQKLKIVDSLKQNGEVVAMMGDGVNDAPALNKADIGVVVGEASDVAKETADLVLLDSSFATIVAAVEEGRGIFDNIRKIILYLMSDAFEEIIAVVGTIIIGLPLPVTAAQILWINMVSDGFPHLALTVDPKRKNIMKDLPRPPTEQLVTRWMKELIFIVSLVGGIIALLIFAYFYNTTDNINLARSIAFATLGVNSLVYVFSVRTLTQPFWVRNPLANKWLNLSIVAGFTFQFLPFVLPSLGKFLGVIPITLTHWLVVFLAAVVMFIIIEVTKSLFKFQK